MDRRRLERLAQRPLDAAGDRGRDRRRIGVRPGHREDHDRLTFERIRDANRRCLGNVRSIQRRGLDLSWPHPFAGDLDGVIGAAQDVPEAVGVDQCPVTMHPYVRPA